MIENDEKTYIFTALLVELVKDNVPSVKFYITIGVYKLDKSKKKHRTVYF